MANLKDLIVNGSARVLGTLYASDIRNSSRITEFIVGTQSSATGSWVGVTQDTVLYDGKNINYFLPVAGSGNASLNLTLSGGTTTGAKPIYLSGTSYVTTQYVANSCINMTYNATKDAWFVNADRDVDTQNRLRHQNPIKAATACTGAKLICGNKDGYNNVASGVSFDISYPILYGASNIAAGSTGDNNFEAIPGINLQPTKASWTGTQYSMVFLVGTLSGTTFTIDSDIFTTTIPTAVDNKVYLPIGVLYSTYQVYFNPIPTLYAYTDGKFQQYISSSSGGLPSQSGNSGKLLTTNGTTALWQTTSSVYPVVETYINGTEWYRVYAPDESGYQWCEQGGWLTRTATGLLTITLLKTYADSKYTLSAINMSADNNTVTTGTYYPPYVYNKLPGSFELSSNTAIANIGYYIWQTAGYMTKA